MPRYTHNSFRLRRPYSKAMSASLASRRLAMYRRRSKSNAVGKIYKTQQVIPRQLWRMDPFPPNYHCTLRYSDAKTLSTGSAVFGTEFQYRLNSLYDPDYTSAGHQPYGYDQMAALYNKYRVKAVRYTLTFTTPGAANDIKCGVVFRPNTTAGISSGNVWIVDEDPAGITADLSSSGDRRAVITGRIEMSKIFGISKTKLMAEDNYSAAVTSNPTNVVYMTFATICYDGTNAVSSSCNVALDFECTFYDRITQSSS